MTIGSDLHPISLFRRFIARILEFEAVLIDTYGLKDIPFLCQRSFPDKGLLVYKGNRIEYRFHGIGCTLSWSGAVISYHSYADRRPHIVVSPFHVEEYADSVGQGLGGISSYRSLFSELERTHQLERLFAEYEVYGVSKELISRCTRERSD
jgi:hypothetical protein